MTKKRFPEAIVLLAGLCLSGTAEAQVYWGLSGPFITSGARRTLSYGLAPGAGIGGAGASNRPAWNYGSPTPVTWYHVGSGYSSDLQTGLPWQRRTNYAGRLEGYEPTFDPNAMARRPNHGRREYYVRSYNEFRPFERGLASPTPASAPAAAPIGPTTSPVSSQVPVPAPASLPPGPPKP